MEISNISLMTLGLWMLFGFVAGFIIHLLDPADVKGGILSTTILGILGAIVGGFISNLIIGQAVLGFSIEGILTAVGGGLLLALLSRMIFRRQDHIRTTSTKIR